MHRSRFAPVVLVSALVTVLLAAGVAPARATPFDARRIPAAAEGVGHIDLDTLRHTALYRQLDAKFKPDKIVVDLDPKLRPLAKAAINSAHGVSFWIADQDTGAVMVEVSAPGLIDKLLAQVPHQKTVRVAGHVARRFNDGNDKTMVAVVGNTVVVSDDQTSMERTLAVLDGRGKSLAARGGLRAGVHSQGMFFFAVLDRKLLDKVSKAAQSKTLQMDMRSMALDVGEVRAELRAHVSVELVSADQARKVQGVVSGLLALASLADDPNVQKMAQRVQLTTSGSTLHASFSMPSAELVKLIEDAH